MYQLLSFFPHGVELSAHYTKGGPIQLLTKKERKRREANQLGQTD